MNYYPINLDVKGRKCLIVGGGKVAFRKARQLSLCGAKVTIVSPDFLGDFRKIKGIGFIKRRFKAKDLNGAFLVVAATGDPKINADVSELCFRKNILVNVVDQPQFCNFTVPSIIRRGKLMVTISTDGASPAFSKELRLELQRFYPIGFGRYLGELSKLRTRLLKSIQNPQIRRQILKAIGSKEMLKLLRQKGAPAAVKKAKSIISNAIKG